MEKLNSEAIPKAMGACSRTRVGLQTPGRLNAEDGGQIYGEIAWEATSEKWELDGTPEVQRETAELQGRDMQQEVQCQRRGIRGWAG